MQPYDKRWWALGVLCFSLLVIGLDNTILNVALPTLVRDLHASASQLQWMVDAYVLVFAGLLLTCGALGDRFGRKLALNAGMLVFAAGSIASAFSGSPGMLIAARAIMGVGGALIMPSTLSILTNIFPPRERGKAIGIWAGVAGLGIVLGPVAGGYLLENYWWGSVFLINVPVVVLALSFGFFLVPESRDPEARPLDPVGAVLSIAGLSALLYAIIEAPKNGWTDTVTLSFFAAAAVLISAFMVWETRNAAPMLDLKFFENPRFSAASMSITLVFFAMFGSVFLLTQHLQFVLGYTPLEAGLRLTPVASLVVAAGLSSRLVDRFGSKVVVASGLLVVALALYILSTVTPTSGYGTVALSILVLGLGMGTTMAPATDSIMGSLPLGKAGVGSAMNDTTRQIGGALGVAVLGSLMSSSFSAGMADAVSNLPPQLANSARDSIGAAAAIAQRTAGARGDALLSAAHSAFVDAMGNAVLVAAGVALLGALVSALFLPATAADDEDAAASSRRPESVEAA